MKPFYVAIDFDGTIVEHDYPHVGPEAPGAIEWMQKFQAAGARLILWTVRSPSEKNGATLAAAVRFCADRGVTFHGVNVNPEQGEWSWSPKVYAQVYIDDAAFGCPVVESGRPGGRPYADWSKVGPAVLQMIERELRPPPEPAAAPSETPDADAVEAGVEDPPKDVEPE